MKPCTYVEKLEKKSLKDVPVEKLVELAADIFQHGTTRLLERVLVRVWVHGTAEHTKQYLDNQWTGLAKRLEVCGGRLITNNGAPDSAVHNAIERAVKRIEKAWVKRGGEQGRCRLRPEQKTGAIYTRSPDYYDKP